MTLDRLRLIVIWGTQEGIDHGEATLYGRLEAQLAVIIVFRET